MRNPLVSIISPVYNIAEFIGDCIESVLNQSFEDFELIIVDDGSSDDSLKICKHYQTLDSRIVIVENKHQGVSAARNSGIDKAKSEYITFIDGDDLIHQNYLEYLLSTIQQFEADIVIADYKKISPYFRITKNTILYEYRAIEFSHAEIFNLLFDEINYMTVWGKLYKRNIIGNQKFKDFALGEDVEFNSRVFPRAKSFFHVPSELYFYRERHNSAVSSKFDSKSLDNVRAYFCSYNNIKDTNPEYLHHALVRLYKNILSLYYISSPEYKEEIKELTGEVYKSTNTDFLHNKEINSRFKHFFIFSFKFPMIYKIFRKFMDLKSKHPLGKIRN